MGAEPTNGDGFGLGWDVDAIRRLHPDNPRFQRLTADERLIVSEPFSDLPGVWRESREATAVTVRHGGVLEERAFTPRMPDSLVEGRPLQGGHRDGSRGGVPH